MKETEEREKRKECEKCEHIWKSIYAGFTYEDGYKNYSQCERCGLTTASYRQDVYNSREIAENKAEAENELEEYWLARLNNEGK